MEKGKIRIRLPKPLCEAVRKQQLLEEVKKQKKGQTITKIK